MMFLQLIKTANKFFKNQTNLVLLYIDENQVKAEIKYEPADNDLFPHLYGELNLDAVYQVIDLEPDTKGLFNLPKNILSKISLFSSLLCVSA